MKLKFNRNLKFKIFNLKLARGTLPGLTMIEMMVAMGVFILILVVVLAIFVQGAKIQRRTAQIQEQLGDARYVIDTMTRELRLGTIKYTGPCAITTNLNYCLYYITADNTTGFFKKEDNQSACGDQAPPCILWSPDISTNNSGTAISTKNIEIQDLYFLVTPENNPFLKNDDGTYSASVQPTVTIHLKGQYVFATDDFPLEFQTTVTTRQYLR